ncbi:MAG: GNAT family N-acetyltransferase [Tissierellales bacterium]|nr:GNAT family N-acetyltransferase [Tissierellales bacterium]
MNKKEILQLQNFLNDMRNQVSQGAYFHYGDLIWRMNNLENDFNESQDLKIWKDSDTLIGFVFILPKENNPEIFIRPELYSSVYADEMMDYSIKNSRADNGSFIETSCLKSDCVKEKYLATKGFKKQDDVMVFMEHQIMDNIDEIPLPVNYSYIQSDECDKYQNSLSWLTNEQVNKLLQDPNFENCLSSIICYKNQEIVSGSLCWYDSVGKCGVFEPVETDSNHQQKGLAYLGIKRSLSILKGKGAKRAYVKTGIDNYSAISLYKKLEFSIVDEDYGWSLEL